MKGRYAVARTALTDLLSSSRLQNDAKLVEKYDEEAWSWR